ncbi:MAG: thioredoxin reductase, partial [Haloquadratum sp. J07HQX50]
MQDFSRAHTYPPIAAVGIVHICSAFKFVRSGIKYMSNRDSAADYEVVVVGGGPAGLQAALYTTRLGHDTALVDRGGGRAAMMLDTHNVIGVTEDTSGNEFLATATEQVESYGGDVIRDLITEVERTDDGQFYLEGNANAFRADRVV